jgi:hypothetical protein
MKINMMRKGAIGTTLFLVFLGMRAFTSPSQKPSHGKVLIHVSAEAGGVYNGTQQREMDLEESARDLEKSLKGSKWLELTEDEETADVRVRILGRRVDRDKGFALGYALDAGAYKTEDEFLYAGDSIATGGGRSRDAREMNDSMQPKKTLGWTEVAKKFGRSLDGFAEGNYDRIVSQRKPR